MFKVFTRLARMVRNLRTILSDGLSLFAAVSRRRMAVAAENLFLRKQLALFREREKKAMPTTPADRFVFSKLARWFDWCSALLIVKPATLIGWDRNAFRMFWYWKSRPVGRPPVTAEVRDLIQRLAAENPTWGEQRIADELLLKLQIRLSPRTVAKYSKQRPGPRGSRDQRWSTLLKSHSAHFAASGFEVWAVGNTTSCGFERDDEGKRTAAEKYRTMNAAPAWSKMAAQESGGKEHRCQKFV